MTTLLQLIGVPVGLLSLGWAIWSHRERSIPRLRVTCQAAVFRAGKGMTFTPRGSKTPQPIKPGSIRSWCLAIHAHNLGPSTVAIEKIAVSRRNAKKTLTLEGCWIAVQEEERVPRVLAPGASWEGLCDYIWLNSELESLFGPQEVWDLTVHLWDAALGTKYTAGVTLSRESFLGLQSGPGTLRE